MKIDVDSRVEAGAPTVEPHVESERRTRDRVRRAVLEQGPVSAATLAGALGLTAAAVRRHLDVLVARGLVAVRESPPTGRRGRGRPARHFVLTDVGHEAMASDYDDLATSALRFLAEVAGPDAVRRFARERSADLERRYAAGLAAAGPGTPQRVEALAAALSADGYAASTRQVGAGDASTGEGMVGTQLCQGHCPVQHVAREFPQLCEAETEAFSRLLGVHVQRLATLAHGEHVCTTHVPAPQRSAQTVSTPNSTSTPSASSSTAGSTPQERTIR